MDEDEQHIADTQGAGGIGEGAANSAGKGGVPSGEGAGADEAEHNETRRHPKNTDDVQPPLAALVGGDRESNESGNAQDRDHAERADRDPRWPAQLQAWCAVALVVITLLYTIYTGHQTRATQEAADAAKSAADTAAAQFHEMERENTESQARERRADEQFAIQLKTLRDSISEATRQADASNRLAVTSAAALREAVAQSDASRRQAAATERIVKESARQASAASRLASAAETSATQTGRAVDVTESNFARAQRPYAIFAITKIDVAATKDRFTAAVSLFNSGQSPAFNVRFVVYVGYVNPGTPAEDAADYLIRVRPPIGTHGSQALLPPIGAGSFALSIPAAGNPRPESEITTLSTTDQGVVVVGIANYSDYQGRPHYTIACSYRDATGATVICGRDNDLR